MPDSNAQKEAMKKLAEKMKALSAEAKKIGQDAEAADASTAEIEAEEK